MTEDQDSAARLHLFASVAFSVVAGLLLVALFLSLRFRTVVNQLPQLTKVWAARTQVADLRPLSALAHLTDVQLSATPVRDLAPLATLAGEPP